MNSAPVGCILLARKLTESEIWYNKPSWWLKVWCYFLMRAFHTKKNGLDRGSFKTNRKEIYMDCNLAIEQVKEQTIDNVIRWLKTNKMATTQKTIRGMIITICNYNEYQSMRTYQNDTENASKTIQERHRNDTGTILIKKNDKNIKNDKNVKKKNPPKNKYGEYGKVRLTEREYKKLNADWGQDKLDEMIRVLDEGIELKGYKYKNHNLAIRKWANNQTEIKSKPQEVLANVYNRFLEEEKNGKNRDNPSSDLFG